jgi:hypothetical protein
MTREETRKFIEGVKIVGPLPVAKAEPQPNPNERKFPWGKVVFGASLALLGWSIFRDPRKREAD